MLRLYKTDEAMMLAVCELKYFQDLILFFEKSGHYHLFENHFIVLKLFTGIIGNVMQSFDGEELYPTVEAKAANLLYFIVKNHPFVDGNKRSGAYAFV